MDEISNDQPNTTQVFRRIAYLALFLGVLCIGTSNIISAFVTNSFEGVQPIALALIPIYLVSALLLWKESKIGFLVAFTAFTFSGIYGLIIPFVNANEAVRLLGTSLFTGARIFDVLFFIVIWLIFFQGYRVIFRSHAP